MKKLALAAYYLRTKQRPRNASLLLIMLRRPNKQQLTPSRNNPVLAVAYLRTLYDIWDALLKIRYRI